MCQFKSKPENLEREPLNLRFNCRHENTYPTKGSQQSQCGLRFYRKGFFPIGRWYRIYSVKFTEHRIGSR